MPLLQPKVRACLSFPYSSIDPAVFEKLCEMLRALVDPTRSVNTSVRKVVMVVHRDTVDAGGYSSFLNFLSDRGWTSLTEVYSIYYIRTPDTCGMWIHGWDNILRESEDSDIPDDLVLQLPGDLREVRGNLADFIGKIRTLPQKLLSADLVIGDFESSPYGSKALIDTYGTFPFLMTWFPEVAYRVREVFHIGRPRSEFFATSMPFLRAMMRRRKFAYEQTLAFLVYAIEFPDYGAPPCGGWRVDKLDLGFVADAGENRGFKEAMDQVERTERMLKMLWREINADLNGDFSVEEFERLDQRSTAMREAAMIIFESHLASPRNRQSLATRSQTNRGTRAVGQNA